MPSVSPDEVARLAGLARIQLAPEETERLAGDLGKIIEYVGQLAGTEDAPATHAAPERGIFRADEGGTRIGEDARDAFPATDGPFLEVPRVF